MRKGENSVGKKNTTKMVCFWLMFLKFFFFLRFCCCQLWIFFFYSFRSFRLLPCFVSSLMIRQEGEWWLGKMKLFFTFFRRQTNRFFPLGQHVRARRFGSPVCREELTSFGRGFVQHGRRLARRLRQVKGFEAFSRREGNSFGTRRKNVGRRRVTSLLFHGERRDGFAFSFLAWTLYWKNDWMNDCVGSLVRWFVRSFVRSFVRLWYGIRMNCWQWMEKELLSAAGE